MNKSNIFKSSEFHMDEGDVLHMIIIDETGTQMTFTLNSDGNEDSVPDKPIILDSTSILSTSFTANWQYQENALGYYLDVATDSAFTALVTGWDNKDVGNINYDSVTSLDGSTVYYYRIRAYNNIGTSIDSDTETATTLPVAANDWFLPSQNELSDMHTNLHVFGVGGFASDVYWSSTESTASRSMAFHFLTTVLYNPEKVETHYVRAARYFTSTIVHSLRDRGEAGGWIFNIVNLGGGNYGYYECTPTDQSTGKAWSNIIAAAIGTTSSLVGEGLNNSNEIVAQGGHTDSAAKLCLDLIT